MHRTTLFSVGLLLSTLLCISSVGAAVSLLRTAALASFIPLSGSLLVVANTSQNTIDLFDADTNTTLSQAKLFGIPTKMVLDRDYGIAYVLFFPTNSVARVNVLTGEVGYIYTPFTTATDLAVSSTAIYVLSYSALAVAVLDKFKFTTLSVVKVSNALLPTAIVAASDDSFFIVAAIGLSGGSNAAYTYKNAVGQWSFVDSGVIAQNGENAVLSPDNHHFLLVSGGGNGNGAPYTIYDYNARNLSLVNGYYSTGAYPTGGAYSLDQRVFVSSNRDQILVFNSTRYLLTQSVNLPSVDPYFNFKNVAVSTDGIRAYGYGSTGFTNNGGALFWFDIIY